MRKITLLIGIAILGTTGYALINIITNATITGHTINTYSQSSTTGFTATTYEWNQTNELNAHVEFQIIQTNGESTINITINDTTTSTNPECTLENEDYELQLWNETENVGFNNLQITENTDYTLKATLHENHCPLTLQIELAIIET